MMKVWCKSHLVEAVKYLKLNREKFNPDNMDVYEFGAYRCESMQLIECLFYAYQIPVRKSFAFDSWAGLPDEAENVARSPVFSRGAFADVNFLFPLRHTELVKCWFRDLNKVDIFIRDMKPASLVHIDCDLYISTLEALTFMFDHRLIVPGTVLAFDEYKSVEPAEAGGEAKAFLEITQKYNIDSEELYRNEYIDQVICWQNCFLIRSIG